MKFWWWNAVTNNLSRIDTGKESSIIEDGLPDAQLFRIRMVDDHYEKIIQFFMARKAPKEFTKSQKKQLVVRATDFHLITGQIYKIGPDEILRRYVILHEQERVLEEAHNKIARGN